MLDILVIQLSCFCEDHWSKTFLPLSAAYRHLSTIVSLISALSDGNVCARKICLLLELFLFEPVSPGGTSLCALKSEWWPFVWLVCPTPATIPGPSTFETLSKPSIVTSEHFEKPPKQPKHKHRLSRPVWTWMFGPWERR